MTKRARSGSEDIPSIVADLLREVPQQSQTILMVDESYLKSSDSQVQAESNFLQNSNTFQSLNNAKNCFDYAFLRKLLQKAPLDTLYLNRKNTEVNARPVVEVVNREYEEEFLREPKTKERPCVQGNDCEGNFISTVEPGKGFTLREFLLPSQYKEYLQNDVLPKERQLCLMCRRAAVAKLYISYRSDSVNTDSLISDYRNYAGVVGEYNLDQCLLPCSTSSVGLMDPVACHCRKWYDLKRVGGIRYYKQVGYLYPDSSSVPFFQ
ncbi:MAG: hypothetical protein CMH46_00625 [Muricauda sp.]|jgi:hypothetical protein|nr:hypothetical protein [Allomuricauda sp.]MAU14028.1 hypothetical protein [Allomuricauda sp.]